MQVFFEAQATFHVMDHGNNIPRNCTGLRHSFITVAVVQDRIDHLLNGSGLVIIQLLNSPSYSGLRSDSLGALMVR